MTTSEVLISKSVNDLQKELAEALALLAEKEKEIEGLKKLVKEQMSNRIFGIPYYGLSREQLMAIDGEFEVALDGMGPSNKEKGE